MLSAWWSQRNEEQKIEKQQSRDEAFVSTPLQYWWVVWLVVQRVGCSRYRLEEQKQSLGFHAIQPRLVGVSRCFEFGAATEKLQPTGTAAGLLLSWCISGRL